MFLATRENAVELNESLWTSKKQLLDVLLFSCLDDYRSFIVLNSGHFFALFTKNISSSFVYKSISRFETQGYDKMNWKSAMKKTKQKQKPKKISHSKREEG